MTLETNRGNDLSREAIPRLAARLDRDRRWNAPDSKRSLFKLAPAAAAFDGAHAAAWQKPLFSGLGTRARDCAGACEFGGPKLPLAAHPCVGHIGLNGAVAEWLKAAVC
jgi:hypothetical protein